MTKEIARLVSLGIGLESTPGTAVSATDWIPTDDFSLKHEIKKSQDDNAFGLIDDISGSAIQQESSVISASGIARAQSIGGLIKMALGSA